MWYMNEERQQLQKMAADFTQAEIKPFVKEMEENNTFPHAVLKKAGELGLIALMFPEKAGGMGPRWIESGIVIEEMSKECNTFACCMAGIYAGASLLCAIGNDQQVETILKPVVRGETYIAGAQCEPVGVARLHDFKTTATFDADGVTINGGKIFCTGAGEADYYSVTCKTAEPYGPPLGEFTIVLVPKDTPGLKIGHIENKMGWHGSSTGQLYFDNCHVPMSCVLASYDMNAEMAMQGGYGIAALLAAGQLGSCVGVYEKTLKYAKERMHGDKSLFDSYQAMRHTFAELWMEIESFRSLVYSVLEDMDRNDPTVVGRAWTAKVKGARLLERVASECMVLNGGNGVIVENDIERYLRDAKMNAIGCFALPHIVDMITTML